MNKAIYNYGRILALLAVLAFFAFYIKGNLAVFRQIFALQGGALALVALITLFNIGINAWLAKLLLAALGAPAPFPLVFKINALGLLSNLLFIKGGLLAKAYYLNRTVGLGTAKYLGLVSLSALAAGLAALAVLAAAALALGLDSALAGIALAALALAAAAVLAKAVIANSRKLRESFLALVVKKAAIGPLLVACLSVLVLGAKLWLIYALAFSPVPLAAAFFIAAIGILSQFAALTPGALGIREGLMAAGAGLIGEDLAAASAVVSLDRAVHTAIVLVLGSASYFSLKRAKRSRPPRTKSLPN